MKHRHRKLSAGILEPVPPLRLPSVPCSPSAFGRARAVGVPEMRAHQPKTPRRPGDLVLFLIPTPFRCGANGNFPLGVTAREPQ